MTKRMSQELSSYYANLGMKVCYLHSDIETLERIQIISDLRKGVHDVLIGINLLREGLDIPEVELVAGHKFHFRNIKPLSQQVNSDQHIMNAFSKIRDDLNPLQSLDIRVQIAHLHPQIGIV